MFLKSEPLEYGGHTITLYELSALHRIEHLEYIAEEEKKLPEGASENELYPLLVVRNIRVGARVVAMSLQQGDMEGPDVETLHKEVVSTWPPEMIGSAEYLIKKLSNMIPPEKEEVSGEDAEEDEEIVTAEKPTPAN